MVHLAQVPKHAIKMPQPEFHDLFLPCSQQIIASDVVIALKVNVDPPRPSEWSRLVHRACLPWPYLSLFTHMALNLTGYVGNQGLDVA
jgi:hypothetical protein